MDNIGNETIYRLHHAMNSCAHIKYSADIYQPASVRRRNTKNVSKMCSISNRHQELQKNGQINL